MTADDLKKIIPSGCRWADVFHTDSSSSSVSFEKGRIHSVNEKQSAGTGIRINLKGRTGFSFTNDDEGIAAAAERAVSFIPYGDTEDYDLPGPSVFTGDFYDEKIQNWNRKEETEKLKALSEKISGKFPDAVISAESGCSTGTTSLINTAGFASSYRSSYYGISASATLITPQGSKLDVWDSLSASSPCEPEQLADNIIRHLTLSMKEAKPAPGRIPVIFTPRAFASLAGILLSGLSGKALYKKISPFNETMGQKLFAGGLTVYEDPLLAGSPFSFPFDDEGTSAQKKYLISRGTPETCITNLKYAALLKKRPSGNASRSYSGLPGTGFSSIIIEPGSRHFAAMIRDFPKGLLVHSFIGLGQSNTITGDFTAGTGLGWYFEKGEILGRVRDCMITDNLFDLLKDEFYLSEERLKAGGTLAPYAAFGLVNVRA